jgi:hypothetical protein
MVNINLVPEKIRSGETLKIIVLLGSVSLVLPVLFWGYRYQGERAKLSDVEKQLDAVNAELNSPQLREIVADVKKFSDDQAALAAKRSIVDSLRQRQVVILRFLDMVPDIIPADSKVNKLVVTDDKGNKKVEMTCSFLSEESVSSVYENLEASSLVGGLKMSDGPKSETVDGIPTLTAKFSFVLQSGAT